ncbi:RsmB/NOP family class I SAM-dependent RNA methyltransferase [Polymorphobacter fuscus]|uniref:RsmB/NOP family class I SAM-dependent RNA methyltransferase n=1 Tax=Sandarakinorhabdus fusca TaxID=1439888 RepID=A0A7C9LEX6_9SPHN|nr:RsmB/NOP family class I SAM-dependent RNA methyltransferase [Polymorphobacter fuscus]KAB7648723.1 RsmB/NOP family class I SAM-dependent RNA methyltransferase [Polymorphobacter fuscus]MQT16287.1 RsmB/NOP family class I SAM-dependent RNA methyltransferase [Polymorphobacter fuscus]NJC07428.1 16S rRNA (cytosine967-C5)-methyltransferase [Polymorphobacter fuscus]
MTPAARAQAAIECLDAVIAAANTGGAAADTIVQRYFSTRRYAGSKDRRAVRDLVFDVIRSMGSPPQSGRAALIGHARALAPDLLELFSGTADTAGHAPLALVVGEPEATPSLAPGWQLDQLRQRFGAATPKAVRALLGRAPLDLRANILCSNRDELLIEMPDLAPTQWAPDGLRAPAGLNIETLPAYHAGKIEVQDEGSQLAALAVGALPGEVVIDLCAGAGGKTLALAAAMGDQGTLIATDTDRGRLSALPQRLARAGVTIATTRLLNPRREWEAVSDLAGAADRVLIDAPCSGTGTWRRNPEARWRLTQDRLAKLTAEQDRLLQLGAQLVRPGGTLTYVVCSLLPIEAEARMAAFLARSPAFVADPFSIPTETSPVTSTTLSPGAQGCDGFFIARLKRVC